MNNEEMRAIISETVNEVLDGRNRLDAAQHAADHQFIQAWQAKEKRKQELWVGVKKNVIIFLIISALGGFGTLIWNGWNQINGKPPSIGKE